MKAIEWTEGHEYLQAVMKKEFETMQKLLANMNLEEQFILRKEEKYWHSMMEERTQLSETLHKVHQDRLYATEKLQRAFHAPSSSLEELLPVQSANSWEILCLRDQMTILSDRMSLQKNRNETLLQLIKNPTEPRTLPNKKGKISVTTFPLEKDRD